MSINNMDQLLDELSKKQSDRGFMADMRSGLRFSTRMNAWPVIARFCDLADPRSRIYEVIAGLYAMHPIVCNDKNMGQLCRELQAESGDLPDDEKESSMSKRFKRLLDADREEMCELVIRIVMYAKSKEKPVDYKTLGKDMLFWNQRTKREWANGFWGENGESKTKKEDK